MNMGFPDVCLTPMAPAPVPIPYPNIGMNAMSMPFIPNILVSMAPAQNMGAKPLMTNGDNAGVAHPMCMMPGGTLMGNPRILMGGMPATHLCVPTYGNNFNEPVGSKIVPSVTNVLLGALGGTAELLHAESGTATLRADGVLHVVIPCLSLRTGAWFRRCWRRMDRRANALLLDLRGNPGGSVHAAAVIAETLLDATHGDLPVAILVDRRTASSAELLTAALQDHRRAVAFGERTYGKGRAAAFLCGEDWIAAAGPAFDFVRPGGGEIQGKGIRPDVLCEPCEAAAHALWFLRREQRMQR